MSWQKELRDMFPVCEVQTYLDSAFGNGGCRAAKDAMEHFFMESFSGKAEGKKYWNQAADDVRKLSAELLGGVEPQHIAITKNTVEGLNIIAQAFPWQEGDNVILNDQEHTSNLMPWLALKDRGVNCKMVRGENYRVQLEAIEAAMDEHTRIVAISHVQNATGYRSDLKKLAELCHKRGIFLVVDAIQTLGVLPCDAKTWGIDAVASGGHKNLLAVPGVGILYIAPQLLHMLKPCYGGSSAVNGINREQWENACSDENSAVKLELSNLNYPGLYALRAGLEVLLRTGIDMIWEHISALSKKLNIALREIGYTVVSAEEEECRSSVVSVSVPNPLEMKAYFAERNIIISKMDAGYVRFSLGIFSNDKDIEKAIEAARSYYETMK